MNTNNDSKKMNKVFMLQAQSALIDRINTEFAKDLFAVVKYTHCAQHNHFLSDGLKPIRDSVGVFDLRLQREVINLSLVSCGVDTSRTEPLNPDLLITLIRSSSGYVLTQTLCDLIRHLSDLGVVFTEHATVLNQDSLETNFYFVFQGNTYALSYTDYNPNKCVNYRLIDSLNSLSWVNRAGNSGSFYYLTGPLYSDPLFVTINAVDKDASVRQVFAVRHYPKPKVIPATSSIGLELVRNIFRTEYFDTRYREERDIIDVHLNEHLGTYTVVNVNVRRDAARRRIFVILASKHNPEDCISLECSIVV